ncbi:MAG: hypothetical protein HKM89_04570 [Gemmatimonadales bacterium]|nr:hypothetical protein [Gemmatimonadales bacterium]
MRVPFANRLTRFGRGKDEAETEAGQVVDLNEPVILFPAEHVSPHHEIERARWKRPGVVVATTGVVFVLGAGAGYLILRGGGDGESAVANTGPLTMETSAIALPDEDLRIPPTARDSGPTAEPEDAGPAASGNQGAAPPTAPASRIDQPSPEPVRAPPIVAVVPTREPAEPVRAPPIFAAVPTREPVAVAAETRGAERRVEPELETLSVREPTAVVLAVNQPPSEEPQPTALDSVLNDTVSNEPAAPDTQAVPIDTTPADELPDSDRGLAAGPPAPAVPEPLPPRDSFADLADRSSARPALLAGVEQLINAINAENWEQRVRPLLLDPVSQREVVKFIRDERPTATLGTVDEVQFDGDEATIIVRLGFRWRGSFGVEERETRRFVAVARPEGGEWQFRGVTLTGDPP